METVSTLSPQGAPVNAHFWCSAAGVVRGVEDGTPKSRHYYGRIDAPFGCAMPADSRPFIVARNTCIVPKQRCIERLPSGYSIREFSNHLQGRYWYVVAALEVIPTKRRGRNRF